MAADENKSGDIDEEQLAKCFAELGFYNARAKNTEAEIREWVRREHRRADVDGDGKVSLKEFVAYYNQYIVGHRRLFDDVYDLGSMLGSGSFGNVLKVRRRRRRPSRPLRGGHPRRRGLRLGCTLVGRRRRGRMTRRRSWR